MNFCKDCKYIEQMPRPTLEYAKCFHPQLVRYNPVSGEPETFCKTERKDYGNQTIDLCGAEGRLFEPREVVA